MTREFSDELLSAFLDGELSEADRANVERHLAANPADRQLYDDLKALRGEVASLPRSPVSPDFADRVVRAALAEAEKQNEARGMVSKAPPVQRHFWRRWKHGPLYYSAAAASAAALAACVLLVVLVGRHKLAGQPSDAPQPGGDGAIAVAPVGPVEAVEAVAALPDQFLSALTAAAPSGRDAVVLRLKVGKGVPVGQALDAALGQVGITALANDVVGSAAFVQEAYTRRFGTDSSGTAAADAIFIEAPLKTVQQAVAGLATTVKDPLLLEASGKLALPGGINDNVAEGESASARPQSFAQHFSGSLFPLPGKAAQPQSPLPIAKLNPDQPVRLLILLDAQ
jgi:negative regulator of sigma E activity